jgi:glutaminyl-peptide cyclotransferase
MRPVRVRRPWLILALLLSLAFLLVGCNSREPAASPTTFDGDEAYAWVVRQCDLGYRITGTEASRQAGNMILEQLEALGWETREQTFTYMDTPVRNLIAWKGTGPALMLGAHYDTRRSADEEDPTVPVMGANDGASGVAVLLELARTLDVNATGHQIYLAFFDAEDNGRLDGWDWIVGSTYMAERWGDEGEAPLEAMILVDMIGDRDLQVYYERNSDPTLRAEIWQVAADLGYGDRIIPQPKYAMLDDHIPFIQRGIPSVLLIDFDYPYWHTTQDTPDKVSAESLEVIGRTLETWLESRPSPAPVPGQN